MTASFPVRLLSRLVGRQGGVRSDRCPGCGGDPGDNWFDRSLCADPCGAMHTRCRECGVSLDGCCFDVQKGERT